MWPFRRKQEETLNEQLLREAGLGGQTPSVADDEPAATLDPLAGRYPAESALGGYTTAAARPALGDVVATAHVSGIDGDTVTFVALPAGDLIVEEERGDADLSPFADVVEQSLKPPYRAEANRLEGDQWGIVASAIQVVQFSYDGADALDLVSRGGTTSLSADGDPVAGTVDELEAAGTALAPEYAVHAERIDDDFWEVKAAAL